MLNQEYQHRKEEHGIELLKQYLGDRLVDVHEDFSTSIDVYIDGQPYDLKVTNLPFVDYVKKYKGNWYSPLELHADVPYLIVMQKGDRIVCFRLSKDRIKREAEKPNKLRICHPSDGNEHVCVDISEILDCPEFVINL